MGRLLAISVALFSTLVAQTSQAVDQKVKLHYGFEVSVADGNTQPSWVEGSVGKFAFNGKGPQSRAFAEHSHHLADTVSTQLVLEATADQIGDPINATEAYLHWRPIPTSNTRYRFKFGSFYPEISLENTRAAWRSPYTSNFSAINSWVAEELRATGVEVTAIKKLPEFGPQHRLILQGSVFGGNDPAGSILAWRGWSIHDRQSRFGDNLPLQPLPLNRPGQMFEKQAAFVEPFKEVDNRPGFYVAAEWRARGKFAVKGMRYDNRGNPEALENGQYAWDTRFNSLSLRFALPKKTTFLAQWMNGNTAMGPLMSGKHVVDNDFDSFYFLLSRRIDRHRLSVRFDRFSVDDLDVITEDNNNESGKAWTIGHRFQFSKRFHVSTEWTRIETNRPGWAFNGFGTKEAEQQLQLRVRYAR